MKKFWEKDDNVAVRRQVLFWLMLFFISSFVIDFSFMYASKLSYTGVVTEKPYDKGISYNEVLAENQRQNELGWSPSLSINCFTSQKPNYSMSPYAKRKYKDIMRVDAVYKPELKGTNCSITIKLKDAENLPITNKVGKILLIRPVSDKVPDIDMTLHDEGGGSYNCDFSLPDLGLWEVRIYIGDKSVAADADDIDK